MASRIDLQRELEAFLGSRNVYYQPPESLKLHYPCFVYELDNFSTKFADNMVFEKTRRYKITLITKSADDAHIDSIFENFGKIKFENQFVTDNLYHNIYTLYF